MEEDILYDLKKFYIKKKLSFQRFIMVKTNSSIEIVKDFQKGFELI